MKMGKKAEKWEWREDLLGEKTSKMSEFPDKTPKRDEKPGIYAIGSKKAGMIAICVSQGVRVRVRKLRSDYKLGRRGKLIDAMGIRFQSDVDFQVLEECEPEIMGMRMQYWAKEAIKKGYTIWNSWGIVSGQEKPKVDPAGIWAPGERLREIAERLGITDAEMDEILHTLERGLEHSRGRG